MGSMDTRWVPNGYDTRKVRTWHKVRPMTVYEAKRLRSGQRIDAVSDRGELRTVTVNGAPKTWKRSPGVEVPWKYGLYEYGRQGDKELTDGNTVGLFVVTIETRESEREPD
jgi:hypothetical protein